MRSKFARVLFVLVLMIVAGVLSPQLIQTVHAYTYSSGITCNAGDQDNFPYGFLCGSANSATGNTDITAINIQSLGVSKSDNGSANTTPSTALEIDPTNRIDINAGFTGTGPAKTSPSSAAAKVLVWIYVLPSGGNRNIFANSADWANDKSNSNLEINSNVAGGSSEVDQCPGTDGSTHGKVYNYNANGPNKSPAAYDPATDIGFENCHEYGEMAVWRLPAVGANANYNSAFRFSIKLKPIDSAGFCIRESISVVYPGTNGDWPKAGDDKTDQNRNANHLAKQSVIKCYKMKNYHPDEFCTAGSTGCKIAITACDKYQVQGYDPNFPGNAVNYRIVHAVGGGVFRDVSETEGKTTTRNSSGTRTLVKPPDGSARFLKSSTFTNITYTLEIQDIDNGNWYAVDTARFTGDATACQPPDTPPTVGFGLNCAPGGLHIAIDDPNDNGSGMEYIVYAWHGNNDANNDGKLDTWAGGYRLQLGGWVPSNGVTTNTTPRTWRGAGDIYFNWPPEQQNNNSGWTVAVYVRNADYNGNPDSSPLNVYGLHNKDVIRTSSWTGTCYSATCTASIQATGSGVVPGRPDGVVAGGTYILKVKITNNGAADPLPDSLIRDNGQTYYLSASDASGKHGLGVPVPLGQSGTVDIPLVADKTIEGAHSAAAYPDYYDLFTIGAACSAPYKVYKQYDLTPTANMIGLDSQDPTSLQYQDKITDNNYVTETGGIPSKTVRRLFLKQINGVETNIDGPISDSRRFVTHDYGVSAAINNTLAFEAGDKFCTDISIDNAKGYIGTGDDLVETSLPPDRYANDCATIHNKPFFKANNGSVESTTYKAADNTCNGEGELGSWVNTKNEYSATPPYYFGASTELSAIALTKIVGFASNQTVASNTPTGLSFANTIAADKTPSSNVISIDSPELGGNSQAPCGLHQITANTTTGFLGGSLNGLDADYTSGAVTITGGDIARDNQVTIIATGDVYITDNIIYQGAEGGGGQWTDDAIPAVNIEADGNIYIAPNVTQLDGQYIAKGTKGKIYTCADTSTGVLKPITTGTYNACKNQLTVNGSFVANKVNMMRTFGSLRDEKPKPIASVQTGETTTNGSEMFNVYRCGGDGRYGIHQYTRNGPSGGCNYITDMGYILPKNTDSSTELFETTTSPSNVDDHLLIFGYANALSYAGGDPSKVSSVGYAFDSPKPGQPMHAVYRYYDSVAYGVTGFHYYSQDSSRTDGENEGAAFYLYDYPKQGGNKTPIFSAASLAFPGQPSNPRFCSRSSVGGLGIASSPNTCAAEVFNLSPEMYLWKYDIGRTHVTGTGDTVQKFDAITSLPPIL